MPPPVTRSKRRALEAGSPDPHTVPSGEGHKQRRLRLGPTRRRETTLPPMQVRAWRQRVREILERCGDMPHWSESPAAVKAVHEACMELSRWELTPWEPRTDVRDSKTPPSLPFVAPGRGNWLQTCLRREVVDLQSAASSSQPALLRLGLSQFRADSLPP
jgi:hypothetical protein